MSLTANSPHHNLLLITDFCVSEALKSLAAQQSSVLHANCDVTTCQNALSMLSSQAYQAILLDATSPPSVPGMVESLRNISPETTSIIVVDSSPSWSKARACFRAGANDYLEVCLDRRPD